MDKKKTRYCILLAAVLAVVVAIASIALTCGGSADDATATKTNERKDVLMSIQQESKLYSAEVNVRKEVSFSSKDIVTVFGREFHVPLSATIVRMPLNLTYKACVDMSAINSNCITFGDDSTVTVVLPDPVIELTSCEIDHDNEVYKQQLFAKTKSQDFINSKIADAAETASKQLSAEKKRELTQSAKASASEAIAGILLSAGYKKVNVTYRPDFDLNALDIIFNPDSIRP